MDELPHLIEILKVARSRNTSVETSDEWVELATGLEATARFIDAYSPHVICPLLQTKAYGRSLVSTLSRVIPSISVEDYLERQQHQQAILTNGENPAGLRVTFDEYALTRPIAPATVMAEQYAHILERVSMPNVTVQAIPAETGEHAGVSGTAFRLIHMQRATVAVLDTPHSVHVDDDRRTIGQFERISQYLRSLAQDPDQTRGLISRLAARTGDQ